jgi:hypothetical protein
LLVVFRPPEGNEAPPPGPIPEKAFVVLKIDRPGAEVFIDGTKVLVDVPGGGKRITIGVEPGRRTLQISKAGFRTVTRGITIERGKKEVITVRLEPDPPTSRKIEPRESPVTAPDGPAKAP